MRRLFWLAALGCCMAYAAQAAEIEGDARPSDARTLVVRGTRIALLDVTPFGLKDTCGPPDATWPCGEVSLRALATLVGGRHITCDLVNKIGHGDFQGRCTTPDGADIATSLVTAGWMRASDAALNDQQEAAKLARRGAWGARPAP